MHEEYDMPCERILSNRQLTALPCDAQPCKNNALDTQYYERQTHKVSERL